MVVTVEMKNTLGLRIHLRGKILQDNTPLKNFGSEKRLKFDVLTCYKIYPQSKLLRVICEDFALYQFSKVILFTSHCSQILWTLSLDLSSYN